jgi:hypothetical protein
VEERELLLPHAGGLLVAERNNGEGRRPCLLWRSGIGTVERPCVLVSLEALAAAGAE